MSQIQGRCRGKTDIDKNSNENCKVPGKQLFCDLQRDQNRSIKDIFTFVESGEVLIYQTNDM
jgi:hypothetical protein